jgi:hypothetical protein
MLTRRDQVRAQAGEMFWLVNGDEVGRVALALEGDETFELLGP